MVSKMKLFRKPSIKKRFKARTTSKWKRKVKSSVNPLYGKKGMGYVRDPKRAIYNKGYNKFTKRLGGESSIWLS